MLVHFDRGGGPDSAEGMLDDQAFEFPEDAYQEECRRQEAKGFLRRESS